MKRQEWASVLSKIVKKPLTYAAKRELKSRLPIRGADSEERYEKCTHLEFIGRTLAGVAPLIELDEGNAIGLSLNLLNDVIDSITSPSSPDFLNFQSGNQPLVDAAFLALAFVRSPNKLWGCLPGKVKEQVCNCLEESRAIKPHFNNWLLFSAMIEAFFYMIGKPYDRMRIDYALRQHEQWYLGDGHYGDGPNYRADFYNSYVIVPFLVEILTLVGNEFSDWRKLRDTTVTRAQRLAEIQERMIGPTGTFPIMGRSIAYRAGAFHHLSFMAYRKLLPHTLGNGQVREALSAVIKKTLADKNNYDEDGWLKIGVNGHQPLLGENYISTGSLYLTSLVFLPLGLDASDEFWQSPEQPWTQQKVWWLSEDVLADKAL